jgi:hypothetical protein
MVSLQHLREKLEKSPRTRAAVGLLPLTVVITWTVIHAFRDKSGPDHGMILKGLAFMGVGALALLWLGLVGLQKNPVDR